MICIFEHIEYLLLRNDCVIVPDFGAFLNARKSATVDYEAGIIRPMTREVIFNSAISHDDGLLAASYARKYGITFPEARNILSKEIEQLKLSLHEDGEATFGRLGTFSMDNEGNIQFSPFSTPESAVMEMGYYPALTKTTPLAEETESDEEESVSIDSVDENRDYNERRFNPNCYYIAINKRFAKWAASIAVILLLSVSVIIPVSEKPLLEERASVVPVKTIDSSLKVESQKREERIFDRDSIAIQKSQPQPESEPETSKVDTEDIYYLIVATFRKSQDADLFIKMNSGRGYDLEKVQTSTLCRVSAKGSSTSRELYVMMNDPAFKRAFPEAWVWHK